MKQKGNPVGLLQSIRRRDLIAMLSGVAVAWPLAAHGQQVGRTYRIAELAPFPRGGNKIQAAIFDELSRNGFVEGHNLIVDPRGFFVPPSEFEAVAVELVKAGPDALLPSGPEATLAAQHATQTIPIVAGLDDPLANKIVASMSHPGGNTTGVGIFATQLDAKRLEVLHEVVPTARRIGVLADAAMTSSRAQLEAAAQTLSIELSFHDARNREDIVHAVDALGAERPDAVCVLASPLLFPATALIIDKMREARVPVVYQWPDSVRDGGLVAYGPTQDALGRLTAQQLIRVLKGTAPGQIPVIQPTKFELWVNLKTAKALGLTIPPTLLARADEVIE